MSWAKLLADRRVTKLPPSKAELDNLRSIVARSLRDATAVNLSADAQFVMAYDAVRTLSLMIVSGGRVPAKIDGRTLQYLPRSTHRATKENTQGRHYMPKSALRQAQVTDPTTAPLSKIASSNFQLLKLGHVSGSSKLGSFFIPPRALRAPTERIAA